MNPELKLLLLEDDAADAELIQRLLMKSGMQFNAVVASNETEFLEAIKNNSYHAVLADNALPQYSSLEALKIIRTTNPNVAFILVTGTVSEEFAVNIIQQGADDYILKTNLTRLPAAIKNAIDRKRIEKEKELVEKEITEEKELSVSIINSLPGIFFLCDSNGKFLRWNKNFEKISGYTAEEIKKMTPEYFFTGDKNDLHQNFIKKIFSTGHTGTEALFVTRDAKKTPYYFTGMAVNFEGRECLICVGLDNSLSKQTESELKFLNEQLRNVSAHLEKIREEEQARIAREVHDQIGQHLTGLKMDLAWIKNKLSKETDPALIFQKINEMSLMLDEAVTIVRKVASDLRPGILDDFGLGEALEWYSKDFAKRSGIPVQFNMSDEDLKLPSSVSIGYYRIYQEILTNIARHAEAKSITGSLTISSGLLSLVVTDDGKGFDKNEKKKTFGLLGMQERAHMFGGDLIINSHPGNGTTIIVSLSLIQEGDNQDD